MIKAVGERWKEERAVFCECNTAKQFKYVAQKRVEGKEGQVFQSRVKGDGGPIWSSILLEPGKKSIEI